MSVIVIKYGGSLLEEPGHRHAFLTDIAALAKKQKIILVHGGGKEISRQMEKAGLKPTFVEGRRFTDEPAMKVVQIALSGLNKEIVEELAGLGAKAEGFSGRDQHLMQAEAVAELGRVGLPKKVDAAVLQTVLKGEAMPVFYSVAEDSKHAPLNTNADDFALAVAIAAQADRLIFLTDTGGVLDGDGKFISSLTSQKVDELAAKGVIKGGMLVKAKACVDALQKGVGSVDIVKGIRYLMEPGKVPPEGTVFAHGH